MKLDLNETSVMLAITRKKSKVNVSYARAPRLSALPSLIAFQFHFPFVVLLSDIVNLF